MPTQTFWNLSAEKRDRLVALAVDEFANHNYDSASLSRIVARAGVAKGSMYQYFADKRDLFLYIFDYASRSLLEAVEHEGGEPGLPFFATLRRQMSGSTRAALAHPQLARIVQRAYLAPPPFVAELIAQGQAIKHDYFRRLIDRGIARGELRADVPSALALLVVNAVTEALGPMLIEIIGLDADAVVDGDAALFATPAAEELYDQIIGILRNGLGQTKEGT